MNCLLAAAVPIPTTMAQASSLWSIRVALLLMVAVLIGEVLGNSKTHIFVVVPWLVGAILSMCHSIGALATFHNSSQAEALESTAQQTEALLGIRVGAGLYVNYVFVVVWLTDAALRLVIPNKYLQFPKSYFYTVYGFLIFIAINGAIVFKEGIIRGIGILCLAILGWLFLKHRRTSEAASI
jgi:hypothetical protein